MGITEFSLSRRTLVFVTVALLSIAGLLSYTSLPRAEDPGFLIRTAVVAMAYPGASAERVERQVAVPLEEALEQLPGATHVRSEIQAGRAIVYVDVDEGLAEIEPTWTEMRETIADVVPTLPPGLRGPFINDDFGDVYGTVVAISGDDYTPAELERAAEALRTRVLALGDARRVQIDGARPRRVFVDVDPARLAALGVSTGYLVDQLASRNLVAPGGDVQAGGRTVQLRTEGAFASADDVRRTALRLPAGEVVALEDLATVRDGYAEPGDQRVRFNGRPAVTVGVSMKADGKLTEFGPQVLDAVRQTQAALPVGLDFDVVVYQPEVVDRLTSEFVSSLIQSVFIVIAVLLLSLGARTGLVVASAVPLTIFAAFVAMQTLGITINQMSLTALIVALGLLVDNAIVVAEQVLNDIEAGLDKVESATRTASQLSLPLAVSSATTAAALLPTYLAESASSEYVAALFEVLAVSLAVSWLLAVTLIPVLCVMFLKAGHTGSGSKTPVWRRLAERVGVVAPQAPSETGEPAGAEADDSASGGPYETPFYDRYRGVLVSMLRHKWVSLGVFAAALVAAGVLFATRVPQQFFPNKSYDVFYVEMEMPYGTSLAETDRIVADLEAYVADSLRAVPQGPRPELGALPEFAEPGVAKWAVYVGSAPPRFTLSYAPTAPRPGFAYFLMTASSTDEQRGLFEQILAYTGRTHPDVIARPGTIQNGPPIDYPVALRVSGGSADELRAVAAGVRDRLREVPGLINVNTDWGPRAPALDVAVDHDAARRAGLSTSDVALSLQTALDGVPLTAVQDGDDLVPVVLRSTDALAGAQALGRLQLYAQQTGAAVPFGQVARTEVVYEPANIERYDGQRTITVRADVSPTAGPFVTPFSVKSELDGYLEEASATWPAGVTTEYGGTVEESSNSQGAIGAKGPIALVIIVFLLVLQFNAIRPPVIVLATLPFAIIGTTLGLLVSGYAFGFMPLLGTIALLGILINNALVLLDRVESEQARGLGSEQALLHASQQRLRPILLTAVTTVAGLLPLWFAGSPLFAPMAVALLFGLIVATVLTPLLVPVLYTVVYRLDFADVDYDPDPDPDLRPRTDAAVEDQAVSRGHDQTDVPTGPVPEVGHAPEETGENGSASSNGAGEVLEGAASGDGSEASGDSSGQTLAPAAP